MFVSCTVVLAYVQLCILFSSAFHALTCERDLIKRRGSDVTHIPDARRRHRLLSNRKRRLLAASCGKLWICVEFRLEFRLEVIPKSSVSYIVKNSPHTSESSYGHLR